MATSTAPKPAAHNGAGTPHDDAPATVQHAADTAVQTQTEYFRITDRVPEQAWYWAAMASVAASAALFAAHKRAWSVFVGQWPPTFLLLALFHKVLRPSR
jgi:hypothetical protein